MQIQYISFLDHSMTEQTQNYKLNHALMISRFGLNFYSYIMGSVPMTGFMFNRDLRYTLANFCHQFQTETHFCIKVKYCLHASLNIVT